MIRPSQVLLPVLITYCALSCKWAPGYTTVCSAKNKDQRLFFNDGIFYRLLLVRKWPMADCCNSSTMYVVFFAVENGEPSMKHLQRWSKDSVLRIDWEDLSLKLIGKAKTRIIKATHFMGGDSACMRELLNTWWESTTEQNHSWQVIVDALGHVDGTAKVIENIEDEFKIRRS